MPGDEWADDGLHYANKRFARKDFSNRTLRNADLKGSECLECNFDGCDLTAAKLMGAQLYRSTFRGATLNRTNFTDAVLAEVDFTGADLRNITLTMNPQTFEGVRLPKKWLNSFLFLLTLANLPEDVRGQLVEIIGPAEYKALCDARSLF
jgi:uncharacterized protein YjbI with pentapeptide repeats